MHLMPKILTFLLVLLILLDVFIVARKIKSDRAQNELNTKIIQITENIASECFKSNSKWRKCSYDQMTEIAKTISFDSSVKIMKALEKIDSRSRDCHLMAHAVATAEMEKDSSSWKQFLTKIDPNYCSGGFIHGMVEGLNRYDKSFKLDENTLPQICDIVKKSVKGGGGDQYCAHISGHILLTEQAGLIPESVNVCSKVPKKLQYQCNGGVFMENITRDNLVLHGLGKHIPTNQQTTDAQEALCRQYTAVAAMGCWREISHMFVVLAENDPQKTYNLCRRAPNEMDSDECYLHATGLLVRESSNITQQTRNSVCNPVIADNFLFRRCISGVINTLLSASKSYEKEARGICEALNDDEEKMYCTSVLERRIGTTTTQIED